MESKIQNANKALLYHGTDEKSARAALIQGIRPRKQTEKSNWRHSVESHPEMVYLTTVYAPFFAIHATPHRITSKKSKTAPMKCAIIEVDSSLLDESRLRPDEDFVEQASRTNTTLMNMKTRTLFIRKQLDKLGPFWKESISELGNCCYKGRIPPEFITRISLFSSTSFVALTVDPCITPMNHKFCRAKYEAITRNLAGYLVDIDKIILDIFAHGSKEALEKMIDMKLFNQELVDSAKEEIQSATVEVIYQKA